MSAYWNPNKMVEILLEQIWLNANVRIMNKVSLEVCLRAKIEGQQALIGAMAWYRSATSCYLSHCWQRSVTPYGIIPEASIGQNMPGAPHLSGLAHLWRNIFTSFFINLRGKKLVKIFKGPTYKFFWAFRKFRMFTGSLFQINYIY